MTMLDHENLHPDTIFRGLGEIAAKAATNGLPPVENWHPETCRTVDIRISADGVWSYNDSPIGRMPMVRLFSTVLRKDEDGQTYLVTPVEKLAIQVDDAPFVATLMSVDHAGTKDQTLRFTTNVGDEVTADEAHPLRFEIDTETKTPRPYVLVRGRLEALIARSVFYDLVELGDEETRDGIQMFGVRSAGCFFAICPAQDMQV